MIGIVGAISAARGGVEFLVDGGDDERILVCDRVVADLLDDLERQRAAFVGEAFESNHPAPRPHLISVGAPGDHEIDVIGGGSLRQQRKDRRVAGIILMRVESLAAGAFRSMLAQQIGFAIHFLLRVSLVENIAPRDMTRASQLPHAR